MKIIGFGHRKRVGKDTAARFLIGHLRGSSRGMDIVHGSFAASLKLVCYNLYKWAGLREPAFYEKEENAHLREVVLEEMGLTPREIWIAVGNKLRDVYGDTWIDGLLRNTKADILIVSDVRYPNEILKIRNLGGKVVKIIRPSIPDTDDVADCALTDWDDWDKTIINDGDMNYFSSQVIADVGSLIER